MVDFSVFNELSLPLDSHNSQKQFYVFFELLEKLREKNVNKIRMADDFKNYNILENVTFQQFLGQRQDRDFTTRLKGFISHSITKIETPLIKEQEQEQQHNIDTSEYFYDNKSTDGGLACCDIWNTIAVSFNSHQQWKADNITIQKHILTNSSIQKNDIKIKHAAKFEHLSSHQSFFNDLEKETRLNITQGSFWKKRLKYFPEKIEFCREVESQIKELDKTVFYRAITILRDVETNKKQITDYNWSVESETVSNNPELTQLRTFTIDNKRVFFEKHIKSLPDKNRIYYLEKNNKICIGYIGKHLPIDA